MEDEITASAAEDRSERALRFIVALLSIQRVVDAEGRRAEHVPARPSHVGHVVARRFERCDELHRAIAMNRKIEPDPELAAVAMANAVADSEERAARVRAHRRERLLVLMKNGRAHVRARR